MRRFLITFFILALFLLFGCQSKQSNRLAFIPLMNGQPIKCTSDVLIGEQKWRVETLQFYVSNIKFNGQNQSIKLNESLQNVHNDIALIGGNCNDEFNWEVTLNSGPEPNSLLEFELAVPFEFNHKNPLTAKFPLNQSDMFWAWQLGHKFFRLDMINRTTKDQDWSFHLGSTGCISASVMRAPKKPCKQPNRYRFTINQFNTEQPIYIHLDKLVNNVVLTNDNHCMGNINVQSCKQVITNFSTNQFINQQLE